MLGEQEGGAPSPSWEVGGRGRQPAQLCGSQGWVIDGPAELPLSPEHWHPFVTRVLVGRGYRERRGAASTPFTPHLCLDSALPLPPGILLMVVPIQAPASLQVGADAQCLATHEPWEWRVCVREPL